MHGSNQHKVQYGEHLALHDQNFQGHPKRSQGWNNF